ncbi:hypothetical protein B0H13DRAFT_1923009 [Mycena leptocephala]|nr:hypothetical protein B0H13DRAFT_1923009 [Mycena leptocephala]
MPIARLPYVRHRGVDTHPGSVLTLAVTEDGKILASGGSQGTRLWNVADMSVIQRPSGAGIRGATLVAIWACQADEAHDVLYAGTQNGYFFCWRQQDGLFEETFVIQMPDPGEITAMAFDSTNNRLCLCSRNDMVQSWTISKDPLTGKWMPTNIFSRRFPRLAPQAITFAAFDNSQDRDIIVLGFHNSGPIYTIRGKQGKPRQTGRWERRWTDHREPSGDAAFNWRDGVFCLDDPTSGPALFRLSDQMKSKIYEIDRTRKNGRPRKVRFGEHGSTLVCGSDHGCVYVFDTRSGERIATLSVGSTEWVQVVATTEVDDVSVIFAAQTRALDFSEEIFVWKRAHRERETSTVWEKMVMVAKVLVVLGCIAFVYQNLEGKVGVLRGVHTPDVVGVAIGVAQQGVGVAHVGVAQLGVVPTIQDNVPGQLSIYIDGFCSAHGRLIGHYACKQQLYTVHCGSPDIVLRTPSPEEAPPIDSTVMIPNFYEPRYLSITHAYLLFIPKSYAWRNPLFQALDRPRHKLQIIKDGDQGFCLHPDVADNWLDLEHTLRQVGKELFRLAPPRCFPRLVSPWFFPARFKFMHKFRTEAAARFGAWRSIENFLLCSATYRWAFGAYSVGRLVTANTGVHATFLDYLEKSSAGIWETERVGALYRIKSPEDLNPTEREQHHEMEWLLGTILKSNCPIPIYLFWGKLPRQISPVDVPTEFAQFVPDADELKRLVSSRGDLKFSRWAINHDLLVWYRDPYTPALAPVAATALPPKDHSSVAAAPFPPLPPNSEQKINETIEEFFIRRRARNLKKMATESSADRQRRTQRAENAKRGVVPSKSFVFVWEKQDGPISRRFDPIHNQWDLCELFEKNDPVFGEGYDHPPDDDSDDEMDVGDPTFPQNIDMESRLPPEVTNMEVIREQHPHDIERPIVDVPQDLGPDFTESDIPERNATKPRRIATEEPEYESVGDSLLDTVQRRFGFVIPSTPEEFVARDPPAKYLDSKDLANVVGMTDIGNELASQKGLDNTLRIFFGQCTEAHLEGISQEHAQPIPATSILCASPNRQRDRKRGPLDSRATDFLEPEIMPESKTPATRAFRNTTSGLGFRPNKYAFDKHDYNAYTTQRDLKLLHTARGRIALQYGGIIARLARSEVSDDDFFPPIRRRNLHVGDCLWDGESKHAYWHDKLSDHEIDLLCGVYHVSTGLKQGGQGHISAKSDTEQTSIVSWWPKPSAWARGSLDLAWWTPQCEVDFFQKRLGHFEKGVFLVKRQADWRHNLKYRKEVKTCWEGYERVAASIADTLSADARSTS